MRKTLGHKKNIRILTYRKYRRSMAFPFEMLMWKCKMCKCHHILPKRMTNINPLNCNSGLHNSTDQPISIIDLGVFVFFPAAMTPDGREKWRELRSPKPNKMAPLSWNPQIFWFMNNPKTSEKYLNQPSSSHISQGLVVLISWWDDLIEMTKSTKFQQTWSTFKGSKSWIFVGETSW